MHTQQVLNILKRGSYSKTVSIIDSSTVPTLGGKELPVKHLVHWPLKRGPSDRVRADERELERVINGAAIGAELVFPDYDGNTLIGKTIYQKGRNDQWVDRYEEAEDPWKSLATDY